MSHTPLTVHPTNTRFGLWSSLALLSFMFRRHGDRILHSNQLHQQHKRTVERFEMKLINQMESLKNYNKIILISHLCIHENVFCFLRNVGIMLWMVWSGPVFCLLLGVSSDYAQPITGQVTKVTCPVIGQAQPELTPIKRQKTGPGIQASVPYA